MRLHVFFFILALLLTFDYTAHSKSLWSDRNMYSSAASLSPGDILIVKIEDISQLRFSISLNDNSSFTISSKPDSNLTGFLPGVSANRSSTHSDKSDFSGKNNLSISIAATVTGRVKGGKYRISGSREYAFNGTKSRFSVSGTVNASHVKGRSIYSGDIADFRFEIKGSKEEADIDLKRGKLKEKESAVGSLTEDEKQKIIIDYLKKMLGELTR
jgi:flagellar basal body L-ring protein FlgH